VIVVTGPGRTGTSFLARLYGELGFDPGGRWEPAVNAGLEAGDAVQMNLLLAEELGVSFRERRGGRALEAVGSLLRKSLGYGPLPVRRARRAVAIVVDSLRYRSASPNLMRWDLLEAVAERHGEELRALAKQRQVVKGPQFCWTIHAWLASQAPIESIVLTVRPLDAMAESRVRVGMYSRRAREWAKHNYCYGIGLVLTAAAQHRVPVTMLRFPDFLDDPDQLYSQLPLPEPRSVEEFRRAFAAVHEPSLVHDQR
jgi:hypothetical protein